MDWVLKASSPWDLTELDRDDFDALAYTAKIGGIPDKEVVSVDLGFDILGIGAMNNLNEPKNPSMASSPSRLMKKPRGHTSDQSVSCTVDGCTADLSSCKDYHQRHRVCESHSKMPVVTINGKEQRFCQQCSRFHSLGEFDEVKRSCRKRLDGHNRRRRKPRAESIYLNYGNFLSNHRGTNLLQFGGSPAYMTKSCSFLTWPNEEKYDHKLPVILEQKTPFNSYVRTYSGSKKKFPFLLATDSDKGDQAVPEFSFPQHVLHTNSSSGRLGKNSEKLSQLVGSKGALSLLSKQTMHTSGITPTNLFQSSGTALQFNAVLDQHLGSETPSRNLTVPDGSGTNNHLNGMIRFQPEGLLETGQLVSFSWN